jgi:hypothetical protein
VSVRLLRLLPALVFLGSLLLLAASPVRCHADATTIEARALFEQGIAKTSDNQWQDAAVLFERSLELAERPATVLNLIVVYEKLDQPLRVVLMVQRLLQIADPVRHESERKQALSLEAKAYPKLARLKLMLVPSSASLRVDGEPAVYVGPQRLVLSPGEHVLTAEAFGFMPHEFRVSMQAAESAERRLTLTMAPDLGVRLAHEPALDALDPPPVAASVAADGPSLVLPRTTAAIGFAALAAAVSVELSALAKARDLSRHEPTEYAYPAAQRSYQRTRDVVVPLAVTGSVIAAAGLLWGALAVERPRRRGLAWSALGVSVALLAVGAVVWTLPQRQIGDTSLDAPTTQEPGLLLVAGALPGLTWSLAELMR